MTGQMLKRYFWLLDLIRTVGSISFNDIADKWHNSPLNEKHELLPKQTFRNHVQAISDLFDIDIVCDRNNGYKYRIEYDTDNDVFKDALINTIFFGCAIQEDATLGNKIVMSDGLVNPKLRFFLQAIRESRIVVVEVFCPSHDGFEGYGLDNEIKPLCLTYTDSWYVVAEVTDYCKKPAIAFFNLNYVRNERLTDRTFVYPKNFKPREFLQNWQFDGSDLRVDAVNMAQLYASSLKKLNF